MSRPKQTKFGRRWILKRTGKALTDVGYNISPDSTFRVNCDHNICTVNNGRTDGQRVNLDVMEIQANLTNKDDRHTARPLSSELQFTKAIDELTNFKENNRVIKGQRNGNLAKNIAWTTNFNCTDESCESDSLALTDHAENYSQVYENFFYGCKHWNFFCVDDDLGIVILSLKVEVLHGKEHVRLLVRSSFCSVHAKISSSLVGVPDHSSDPYSWVDTLSRLLNLTKPLQLITHHKVGTELVKLDRVFVKSEFKIGVLYLKHGQETEEDIFSNASHSAAFETFLNLLGERVTLRGFTGYSGGLDTSNGLNGTQSVYTQHRNNKIMFHVSTLMPNCKNDLKHLGKKRHIGNDVLCVVFTDATETAFSPSWIKSQFIYAYVLVQVVASLTNCFHYKVSIICRDEVPWFGPCLPAGGTFEQGDEFRQWLLNKIINGDRACYAAPKFASVQERTRCQIMNGIFEKEMASVSEGAYDRRSTPSVSQSDNLDSLQALFPEESISSLEATNPELRYFYSSQNDEINSGDVTFLAGKTYKKRLYGVRAVMCRKSRVFRDMLTDWPLSKKLSLKNIPISEDSLVKLALKKVKSNPIGQSNSRKGKFAIETSCYSSRSLDEHVMTTSIKKGGQTYEISLDCIGRTREFVMNEFEADIFSGVIEYIHYGKCTITYETLPGLLCAATYYELPELRLSCLNCLDDVITVKTVCPMLNIVEEYVIFKDGKELQQKLLDFFFKNLMEIKERGYFSILSKSRMMVVLSRDWKCDIMCKVSVAAVWAKSRDVLGWRSRAKSVLSSCDCLNDSMLDGVESELAVKKEENTH